MPYFSFPKSSSSNEPSPAMQDSPPPAPTTWFSPAVDRLICALDADNVGPTDIIRRVKKQFPELRRRAITVPMVDRRLQVLDQNIDIDYFKYTRTVLDSSSTESVFEETRVEKQGSTPTLSQVWKVGIDETGKKTEKPMPILVPETSQRWEAPMNIILTAATPTSNPNLLMEPIVATPSLKNLKKSKSLNFAPPSAWKGKEAGPSDSEHIRHIFESPLLAPGSKR